MAKPPMISLDSMNGPSVTMGLPSLYRTVVAVWGPFNCSPPTILPARLYSSNHYSASFMPAAISSAGMVSKRSWSSMVPTKSSTYFIATSSMHDEQGGHESTASRPGELSLLLAQERHDPNRRVGAQRGPGKVLRLDLERLLQPQVVAAPDGVLEHRDGERRGPRQPARQTITRAL